MAGEHVAIQIARERRMAIIEEEEMTKYNESGRQIDYEYKILRSNNNVFAKRSTLERVKAEEALAGWELIEKFDNKRLRFRRPIAAQRQDDQLPPGIDAYRTQYGMPESFQGLIAFVIVAIVLAVVILISNGAG